MRQLWTRAASCLVAGARVDWAPWQRYGASFVMALFALGVITLGSGSLLVLATLSITMCALVAGLGPALVATAIVVVACLILAMLWPSHVPPSFTSLAMFVLAGTLGGMITAALRAAARWQPPAAEGAAAEHFSTVFDCAPVAIMIVRLSDGQLVDVNGAFTELSGYTRTQAVGRTSAQLQLWVEPEQFIQKLKANRHSDTQELQFLTSNDEVRDVLVSVRLIQFHNAAHLLVTAADVTDRKRARELEHIANHDTLTKLPNRLFLQSRLQRASTRASLGGELSAVLCIDLDGFKGINDKFGHDVGDELLQMAALRMKGRIRSGDTLARVGGDEFVILLERLVRKGEAEIVAAELLAQMSLPFTLSRGREVRISSSIGISYFGEHTADAAMSACKQADIALYAAKRAGRNTVRVFRPELLST